MDDKLRRVLIAIGIVFIVLVLVLVLCWCGRRSDVSFDPFAIDPSVAGYETEDGLACFFLQDQFASDMSLAQWNSVSDLFPTGSVYDDTMGVIYLPPENGINGEAQAARVMQGFVESATVEPGAIGPEADDDAEPRSGERSPTDDTRTERPGGQDDVGPIIEDGIPSVTPPTFAVETPLDERVFVDEDIQLIVDTTSLNYILPWSQSGKPGWGPADAPEPGTATTRPVRQGSPVAVFDTGIMPRGPNNLIDSAIDPYLIAMTEKSDHFREWLGPGDIPTLAVYALHGEAVASVFGPGPGIAMYTPFKPAVGQVDVAELRVEIILAVSDNGPGVGHPMLENLRSALAAAGRYVHPLSDNSVINMSFAFAPCFDDLAPLKKVFDLLKADGHTVVAAAGNYMEPAQEGGDETEYGDDVIPRQQPMYPAAFESVVGVAALSGSEVAPYSRCGAWIYAAARGDEIAVAFSPGDREVYTVEHDKQNPPSGPYEFTSGFAKWSGTSFAAPQVAAAIAEGRVSAAEILNSNSPKGCEGVPTSAEIAYP